MVKKIAGSVMDVFKAQGHSQETIDGFEGNRGRAVNQKTIGNDIPRTALIDFSDADFAEFSRECHDESTYKEHYLQGNFDGGGVEDLYSLSVNKKATAFYEELQRLNENSPEYQNLYKELQEFTALYRDGENIKNLHFAYRDDEGQLCALGLTFNSEVAHFWALQIFRNTVAPLQERTTTLFSQGGIVTSEENIPVELDNLPEEINLALGSEKVAQLISGLIDDNGDVSIEKYNELTPRIVSNRNIDNRDSKKQQLDELFQSAGNVLPAEYVAEITKKTQEDINFFKEDNFEQITTEIFARIKNEIALKVPDKNESDRLIAKSELTFYAIRFELKAYSLLSYSDARRRASMLEVAEVLRAERDNPSDALTIEEIIQANRMRTVPEKPIAPQGLNQSFFRTNYGAFTVGVGGLLTAGALLILSGIFSPLGLAYAGVASLLAIGGAIAAGVVGLAGMIKTLINEKNFQKEASQYKSDMEPYEKELKASQKASRDDIQEFTDIKKAVRSEMRNAVDEREEDILDNARLVPPKVVEQVMAKIQEGLNAGKAGLRKRVSGASSSNSVELQPLTGSDKDESLDNDNHPTHP